MFFTCISYRFLIGFGSQVLEGQILSVLYRQLEEQPAVNIFRWTLMKTFAIL